MAMPMFFFCKIYKTLPPLFNCLVVHNTGEIAQHYSQCGITLFGKSFLNFIPNSQVCKVWPFGMKSSVFTEYILHFTPHICYTYFLRKVLSLSSLLQVFYQCSALFCVEHQCNGISFSFINKTVILKCWVCLKNQSGNCGRVKNTQTISHN